MVNLNLFRTKSDPPAADAVNEAGGRAYRLAPKHALAQLAATGTFQNTFYASGVDQLDEMLKLAAEVDDPVYLAKLAVYSREKALMKDMPAALALPMPVKNPVMEVKTMLRLRSSLTSLKVAVNVPRKWAARVESPLKLPIRSSVPLAVAAPMVVKVNAPPVLVSEN